MTSLDRRCTQELESAGVAFERNADGALRVRARSTDVGDLIVAFDGGEITVFIGDLTHCHFTPGACGDLKSLDPVGEAVKEAVEYVHGVLDDKWVVWRYPNGAGGSYQVGDEEDPMADAPLGGDARLFVWSGPLSK